MRLLLILLIPAFILTGCSSKTNSKETSTEVSLAKENLTQVNLDVKGMTCEGCENTVVAGIKKLEGIQEGMGASLAYLEAIDLEVSAERKEEIKESLLKYCKHDTEAMVRLVALFANS